MGFNLGPISGYLGLIAIMAIVVLVLTGHCNFTFGTGVR